MTKVEHVKQTRNGFTGTLEGAGFCGMMLKAVISY